MMFFYPSSNNHKPNPKHRKVAVMMMTKMALVALVVVLASVAVVVLCHISLTMYACADGIVVQGGMVEAEAFVSIVVAPTRSSVITSAAPV